MRVRPNKPRYGIATRVRWAACHLLSICASTPGATLLWAAGDDYRDNVHALALDAVRAELRRPGTMPMSEAYARAEATLRCQR